MASVTFPTTVYILSTNNSYSYGGGGANMTGYGRSEGRNLSVEILKHVYSVSIPLLCITGMLGNLLALFVFISKPMRRTSCSWYLAARSVSDGGFLFATFFIWASDVSEEKFFHTNGVCQVIIFMSYMFAFLSVWLTVIVTLENYIRICRPFSVQRFCSVVIAQRAIAGLCWVGLLLYNYPFWSNRIYQVPRPDNTTTYPWCTGNDRYAAELKWISFVDMLITLVVPSFLIIILMVAITLSLIKSLQRQSRLQAGSSRSNGQPGNNPRSSRSSSSPQAKVTRMLFAVSFFFILLNGPSHIIRAKMAVLEFMGDTDGNLVPSAEAQFYYCSLIIYYSSFAVNLIIYLTCGGNFRKQFKETYFFCCAQSRYAQRGCSEMTAMSVVRLEEVEHRNEDHTALLENGTPVTDAGKNNQPS